MAVLVRVIRISAEQHNILLEVEEDLHTAVIVVTTAAMEA